MTAERSLYFDFRHPPTAMVYYTIHAARSRYNNRKSGYYRLILSTGLRPCAHYTIHAARSWYNVRRAAIILEFLSPAYGDGVLYHSRCAFTV